MERAGIPVELAMNYGNPSIASAVRRLVADGADDFFVMPLYPQYGMSSYETVLVKALREIRRLVPGARVAILQPFYNDPAYIDALAVSARAFLSRPFDRLLISFHGVPERHIRKTDSSRAHCLLLTDCCRIAHPVHAVCYRHQCFETARLFAAKAGLSPKRWSVAFQSRLGKDPWLTPGTDREIERLAKEGVKRLLVLCPSFVSDCLETLEEIRIHGTELFVKHGGKSFDQIPCLNDHPQWIEFLADKIRSWRDRAP
jgi:ferrochelatase